MFSHRDNVFFRHSGTANPLNVGDWYITHNFTSHIAYRAISGGESAKSGTAGSKECCLLFDQNTIAEYRASGPRVEGVNVPYWEDWDQA